MQGEHHICPRCEMRTWESNVYEADDGWVCENCVDHNNCPECGETVDSSIDVCEGCRGEKIECVCPDCNGNAAYERYEMPNSAVLGSDVVCLDCSTSGKYLNYLGTQKRLNTMEDNGFIECDKNGNPLPVKLAEVICRVCEKDVSMHSNNYRNRLGVVCKDCYEHKNCDFCEQPIHVDEDMCDKCARKDDSKKLTLDNDYYY